MEAMGHNPRNLETKDLRVGMTVVLRSDYEKSVEIGKECPVYKITLLTAVTAFISSGEGESKKGLQCTIRNGELYKELIRATDI